MYQRESYKSVRENDNIETSISCWHARNASRAIDVGYLIVCFLCMLSIVMLKGDEKHHPPPFFFLVYWLFPYSYVG